jgi:SAM-dependent methyltransferase
VVAPHAGAVPGETATGPSVAEHAFPAELLALPAPQHLLEYVTRSLHLHLGYFESTSFSIAQAQEQLILRSVRLLTRQSLVADAGCGLGGTAQILAGQGHRVYAFDPCARSITYARSRVRSPRVQFLACDLEEFSRRARGARLDALFLTEVLQHFTDLPAVLMRCRAVLRPGGLVIVHDIVRHPGREAHADGFHPRGALATSAAGAGFDLREMREIGCRTSPTLSRLLRALAERRDEIVRAFAPVRPAIESELEDCQVRLRALEHAFARQELFFETSVLRCSSRLGNDSVVLRAPRAPSPGA